ncbi:NAD-specific glutamate dehydrogenase [Zancudomyces culisetae]|uniref:NAD-specific glutamate dehydrogenase n=1 Tax=Zancudomyces culisetae TaxID=1213189 RepID=A0A1R1PZC1_ZANCU|nr:NAD-specific glutamate dehydrogenase [Zancudomyces culisetae]|eukprot:OMH86312.1 NAD-specific glutamate dehydrogenase [Zancudomyces culisetae]
MTTQDQLVTGRAGVVDKQCHKTEVISILEKQGYIPDQLIKSEVEWFYESLGINDMYFETEDPSSVAEHILGIYAAQMRSFSIKSGKVELNFERKREDSAVFIHTSEPGVSRVDGPHYEERIDDEYLDISTPKCAYNVESHRSKGHISESFRSSIRAYFIRKCEFEVPEPTDEESRDIKLVSDKKFLRKTSEKEQMIYQRIVNKVLEQAGPVIEVVQGDNSNSCTLLVGYRQGSTKRFFSSMSDLYHFNRLYSSEKHIDQFSNGVSVMNIKLSPVGDKRTENLYRSIEQVARESSLLYCIPSTPLKNMFKKGQLSVQEVVYAHVCWIFAQHFLNRLGSEYSTLVSILDKTAKQHVEILNKIKKRLRQETFTRDLILDVILRNADLVKKLYRSFADVHYVRARSTGLEPSMSMVRMHESLALSTEDLEQEIRSHTKNSSEELIMKSFLEFNKNVLKTNFYQPAKVALAFRMSPNFLPEIEYPVKPYGILFMVGAEFRGFHVRFQDISRGGIRVIRSRNEESYNTNQRSLFDENYALASTQHRKNKDIPEGGSKGTILLDLEAQDRPFVSFEKYIDALLDILLIGNVEGKDEKIVDLVGKPEILFCGPDEGTAGYMDWASQHARRRGAYFWSAFTTGKSQSLGGIPHDLYGMTTLSVHQNVLGVLEKLGIDESSITKLQTGGPDGDLGSNEIKISKDKTVSVVDGSGVLHDPEGIDRQELTRLALARKMIVHFDVSKLGPKGFRVLVDQDNITLPDGQFVRSGLEFRNTYHLNPLASATLFVPCGGRPESVDVNNVAKLIDANGVPHFKYIVEGANLFFTQDARLRLENAGVHLIKDASANKGGVTSSSLEVLASLALSEKEHKELMCVSSDGTVSEFYNQYVKAVQEKIKSNARNEFDCVWHESSRTGKPKSIVSDEVSRSIVDMRAQLETTELWDNLPLRKLILTEALPPLLLQKIGIDTIMTRIPTNYLRAIFSAHLASHFIYKYGYQPTQFAFFEFMGPYYAKLS